MSKKSKKNLQSIVRWNVFESGLYLSAGRYEPIFPFAMTHSEAFRLAQIFRLSYSHLVFVVLPCGCSF